jgi:hypothetical protein
VFSAFLGKDVNCITASEPSLRIQTSQICLLPIGQGSNHHPCTNLLCTKHTLAIILAQRLRLLSLLRHDDVQGASTQDYPEPIFIFLRS